MKEISILMNEVESNWLYVSDYHGINMNWFVF